MARVLQQAIKNADVALDAVSELQGTNRLPLLYVLPLLYELSFLYVLPSLRRGGGV
jgi:hypothetical protein